MGLFFAISGMVLVLAIFFIVSSDRRPDERVSDGADRLETPRTSHDQYGKPLPVLKDQRPLRASVRQLSRTSPLERRGLSKTVLICVLIISFAVPLKEFIANSPVAKAVRRAVFGLSEQQYVDICLGHVKPAMEEAMRRQTEAELAGDMDDPLAFEEAMLSIADRAGFLSVKALVAACESASKRMSSPKTDE